jgi:hypothetical protein
MKTQNQNPKIEVVKYKGVDYKIRTLEIRDRVGKEVLKSEIRVAPIELNEAYNNNAMSVKGSKEQLLDASIDYYVTKEQLETLPSVITQNDMVEVMAELMSIGCEVESNW